MNGFLLNMINRHQGTVDKVQPRTRSLFEPETAAAVAADNAYASATDTRINESRETGFEKQSVFSKSPGLEKPIPENPPSAPLSVMLQQTVQTDEGSGTADLNSLDRNRMDLMNGQIQDLLARLAGKPEAPESLNDANGLQKPASFEATDQTAIKVVSNEMGLANRIEETLGRLTSQTSYRKEGQRGFEEPAPPLSPANAIKTEADPLLALPPQPGKKGEEPAEALNNSIINQAQTVCAPVNSQAGSLQTPAWLTALQTDINKRWREINAKSQAEPVINVTIGRVEVRAINTESAKPGTASKKPTGVMSLDDYLRQRESKGRT